MKKIRKDKIKVAVVAFMVGLIISGVSVYAVTLISSNKVSYADGTVEEALDSLYEKANKIGAIKKFCQLKSGEAEQVGAEYDCDPGDGLKRTFYVLTIRNNEIDLIMDRNLNEGTMTWNDAMKYFRSGEGLAIKNAWINVMNVDLPKAQAITDAVGYNWIAANSGGSWWCFGSKKMDIPEGAPFCNASTNQSYAWLFNHLTNCTQAGCTDDSDATAAGYWTHDLVSNTAQAWGGDWSGALDDRPVSLVTHYGVRPVITVLKQNLYE